MGRRNLLIVEYGADLPDNFSSGKIPLDSEQRCQTELAIDRATDLAGNTNRGAIPGAPCQLRLIAGFASVAGFSAVAFGHPDGLDALPVGAGHQVAHRAVAGNKFLFNAGKTYGESALSEAAPEILRQGGNLLGALNSLRVKRLEQLARPVRGLAELLNQGSQLWQLEPKSGFWIA